jgi:hypothetical protein
MDAGRRKDRGQPVQELQGGEAERGAARGIRRGEDVEDLVGTVADEMEAIEGKRWPGAIPDEPLEPVTVGGLDTDAGVEAEPAAVVPCEHVLGLVGLQEAVAGNVAEHSPADRVLEALEELGGEGGGFVEAEVGFRMGWVRIPVTLDPLEEPVDHA